MGKATTAVDRALPDTVAFNLEHHDYVYEYKGDVLGIKQRRLNGEGVTKKFRKGDRGISSPFGLPEVKAAIADGRTVLCIPDGERDVLTLRGLGCVATCAPYGMGSWNEVMVRHLVGATVVYIFVDQDGGTGLRQARKLRALLLRRTIDPGRINLVRAAVGKDIYDHYVADGGPWVQIEDDEPQRAPEEKRPAVEFVETMLPSALQLAVARLEAMPEVGLKKVSDDPPKWNGRCPRPEHDDKNPSFAIGLGDRVAVVVKCSGCDGTKDEFAALLEIDPKEFSAKSDPDGDKLERVKEDRRLYRRADREVREEEASALFIPPEYRKSLRDELAIQEEPLSYLVGSLFVEGHNVRLVGKNKSGKTTLVENLWRSLLDGSPFLSAFSIDQPLGKVAYWNGELSEKQFRSWCREMNIVNQDQGIPLNTRGKLMDLSLPVVQEWTIDWLVSNDVEVWIIDPFTSFYFGEENSNTEVKKWTLGLDMVKDQAGIKEVILVTHEGRAISTEGEEHTRGASAIEGWADALWTIAKDGEDRFFGAFGRDVDLPQQRLGYRSSDRALSLAGGSRAEAKDERLVLKILSVLVEQNDNGNGPGYGELESSVKGKGIDTNAIPKTVKGMVPTLVMVEKVGNKNEHWITELGRERLRLTNEGEGGFVLR